MKEIKKIENIVDEKRVLKTMNKIAKVINSADLNIPEMITLYGNLGYNIGLNLSQIKGQPNLEEIQKIYYKQPTVDIGLMLQGLLITSWREDFLKHPYLSSSLNTKEIK